MPNSIAINSRSNAWVWAPVLIWIALMFTFSTSLFTAANTAKIIDPILQWLIPGATATTIAVGHVMVRKAAHFTEYCVLFWLLIRGPLAGHPYVAFAVCVGYAMLDETHQIFVPGRTPSPYDVALDSTGAMFGGFSSAAASEL